MPRDDQPQGASPAKPSRFASTRWSVVLAAGDAGSPQSRQAMAALCETYWYPLYAYVRRRGYDSATAEDLTQAFFTRLLDKGDLRQVSPERGRFRSFLLASMKHFLSNEWDRTRAAKRGGGRAHFSIDSAGAEQRYGLASADSQTPEALFEKQWALALLDRVDRALRQEFVQVGKEEQFDRLRTRLTGDRPEGQTGADSYRRLAEELGMSEGAVKVAAHRLRKRFQRRLREEIAQSVDEEADIDEEIRSLFDALRA